MSACIYELLDPDAYAALQRAGVSCGCPACRPGAGSDGGDGSASCCAPCDQRIHATSPGPTADRMGLPVGPGPLAGLGDPADLNDAQTIQVSPKAKAFLDDAAGRIDRLRAQAEEIGPPGFFDLGKGYGERWTPIFDAFQALLDEARAALADDPEAMHEWVLWATKANNAFAAIRLKSPSKDLFDAALAALKGNPTALWTFVERQVASVGRTADDTKQAAKDIYGDSLWSFLWALPRWMKITGGLAVLAGGAYVFWGPVRYLLERNPRRDGGPPRCEVYARGRFWVAECRGEVLGHMPTRAAAEELLAEHCGCDV